MFLAPSFCWAANALIVHDGTLGTEADALGNLTGKLVAKGFTVTPSVGVPDGSLTGYQQIWDIRFDNTTPLSGSDITAYVGYMAGGGSLSVIGENLLFVTRDNSIVTLIAAAGGGSISLATPANAQTVNPQFTGPAALTNITFLAAAGTPSPGTGALGTVDGSRIGAKIVWAPGQLLNAAAGSLIVVFDVNFLQAGADANSQTFANNLIGYLAAPAPRVVAPVPAPSSLLLVLTGACGIIAFEIRRRNKAHAA